MGLYHMKDGNYVYYTIQARITHKSPWLKPDGPLSPYKDDEWRNASFDAFGSAFDPRIKDEPKFKKSSDERHDV